MEAKKLLNILEAIAITVMGILIAILGSSVINTYFGVVLLVAGVILFVICLVGLIKSKELLFGSIFSSAAFIILGSAFLGGILYFEFYVNLIVLMIIAFGSALVLFGIYNAIKENAVYGIGQITLGAIAVVVGTLYLTVPEFRYVFWIIVGILVAIYGIFYLVATLLDKKITSK